MQRPRLARHAFYQHANRHSTWESMRIYDNVRLNATFAEGHIDRRPLLRAHALLAVSRGELVANYRAPWYPNGNVYLLRLRVASIIPSIQFGFRK